MSKYPAALPTGAPFVLQNAYANLPLALQAPFYDHLVGGTSANWLSDWCTRAGCPVSATTIKLFRQRYADE